jgi:OOP family OmpA-OmpF porin
MGFKNNSTLLFSSTVCLAIAAGNIMADSRGSNAGYASDSKGNILRSGSNECIQTGSWSQDKATVAGCDGYTVDKTIELLKGGAENAISTFIFPQAELFAFDSDRLTSAGEEYIKHYRQEVGDELVKAFSITVIGYTDSTGDADYNMGLSKRRAQAVADYLASLDVPAEKIHTLGRGENDPIMPNDTKEGRAQNRRVQVIVTGQARALDAMIFPSVALFERRSAEITPAGKALMERSIQAGKDHLKGAVFIEIVGHTDDVGDDTYNQELSEQRAAAVQDYLISAGIDASKLVAWGAGERLPIASNATPEGRTENRRVEVLVLGRAK